MFPRLDLMMSPSFRLIIGSVCTIRQQQQHHHHLFQWFLTFSKKEQRRGLIKYPNLHFLFIIGIMALLKERDLVGVEASIDDPIYIKAGFLKEKHPTDVFWKTKYVQVRRGILTFYNITNDNNINNISSITKNKKRRRSIQLRASLCISCQAVQQQAHAKYTTRVRNTNNTFMFELSVQGQPR